MTRVVTLPPADGLRPDGTLLGGWWHEDASQGRIVCDLCPRECHLKPGDRGFCFVRQNVDGQMVLTTYGRSTGFCIDPIEKKPLNHFLPGTSVLSFGTAGCNLGCKFCQNWDISKSREVERLSELALPDAVAAAAKQLNCRSVAYTYNDPIVWAEYAIDTARACRAAGVYNVAVTAGYISPAARGPFYEFMDAANVDLKGFTEEFYERITYSHLQPVLETLEWLKRETSVWFEITNLIIPQTNDAHDDIRRMCEWILQHCGDEVPVHFTAFHPDFRMRDLPNTPHETLLAAYDLAKSVGLRFVYTGNVNDVVHQSTYCPHCQKLVIERDWYALGTYRLEGDRCGHCGGHVAGRFEAAPGTWGRRRQPVDMSRFARTPSVVTLQPPSSAMTEKRTNPSPTRHGAHASGNVVTEEPLTDNQQLQLRHVAAQIVAAAVQGQATTVPTTSFAGVAQRTVMGAFVTLKRQGRLRACCGYLGQPMPLADALRQAAIRTATEDYRLPPIQPDELALLTLDVNLLFNFQPLPGGAAERLAAVTVGRHGLQIRRGSNAGLLLPIVPVEHAWDAETYLRQVCTKANLPSNAWEDPETTLQSFESIEFGGPFDASVLGGNSVRMRFTPAELKRLSAHATSNIAAFATGATPNYYLLDVSDGTVAGLCLTIHLPDVAEPMQLAQLSVRPGIPLQASLLQMCEAAARSLAATGTLPPTLRANVTVLYDAQMLGTAAEPDFRGFEPERNALVLLEGGRSAWVFKPGSSPDEILATAQRQFELLDPNSASLLGLTAQSTEPSLVFSSVHRAQRGASARRPAVAGTFYPDSAAELDRVVDRLFAGSARQPAAWRAAMVPHAGLVYSGRLAAAVLNRLEIPELVIILGPKHTRHGVEWAVAPHDEWLLPGGKLASDPALARELAQAIPGLQLDAAAHQQEHAIEVELPLLHRLAPRTRVVGIALGGGNWEHCQKFARGLADVMKRLPTRPLLLISSDMNHFAPDDENRRLDALALDAMRTLDPAHLLTTVRQHNISMCGVLPAVVVMETLRQLGGLTEYEQVGYATSADVSGDTSRVVGYAGVLLN